MKTEKNKMNRMTQRKRSVLLTILSIAIVWTACVSHAAAQPEVKTEVKPSDLYAQSAVLMDADTGRILFAKKGQEALPMASTTKIMTCILALENGTLSDTVKISAEAARQPQVKLGAKEGQKFALEDLLYSLMLESHNDSAVAIAEHIGGSVQEFADMMNEKAEQIGCTDTYFITPNGLDAQDEQGIHHTTAEDLAKIMKYCIMDSGEKSEFLHITQTASYTFRDSGGNGSYSCTNHNAFLNMMDGALSGKTGFTADAGYCYVGALRQDERTFIVALLACGWPNNKGYKWSDARKLMKYGLDNYLLRQVDAEDMMFSVKVENGFTDGFPDLDPVELTASAAAEPFPLLLKNGEDVRRECTVPAIISAPVKEGDVLGTVTFSIDGIILREYPVKADRAVGVRDAASCIRYIRDCFLMAG